MHIIDHKSFQRRALRQKKRRAVERFTLGVLAVLFMMLGSGLWWRVSASPVMHPAKTSRLLETGEAAPIAWPACTEAAIGEQQMGVLATHGSRAPVPTASVAKLITALAVLREKPLAIGDQGPTITLQQDDVDIYNNYIAQDGSVTKVAAGERITEYQMLQAMLLPSSNNLADSLAIWAFGSLQSYAVYANNMVQRLGMYDTTIGSDASGLAPNTTSTARDLIILGQKSLANPVIAQIVSQKTAVLPEAGQVHNVNGLLGHDSIDGIKVGNSDQAGGVFLFSADAQVDDGQSARLIGVVIGCKTLGDAFRAVPALLRTARQNLQTLSIADKQQVIAQFKTPWGAIYSVTVAEPLSIVVWKGTALSTEVNVEAVRAGLASGKEVGSIAIKIGSSTALTSSLVLREPIVGPSLTWRIFRTGS